MSNTTPVAKRTKQPPPERIDPLRNISGICYDMEDEINHAIAISRTALDQLGNDDDANGQGALELILYRLEQIAESRELIVKNLQHVASGSTKE